MRIYSPVIKSFSEIYIYNRYDFEAFSVIRLNMSYISQRGIHGMTSQLSNLILKAGIACGVFTESSEISNNPSDNLASLIESVRRKYGKKAVVLVDETPSISTSYSRRMQNLNQSMHSLYRLDI